jgi:hypothetical protein
MNTYQIMALIATYLGGGLSREVWTLIFGGRKRKLDEAEILAKLSREIRDEIRTDNQDLRDRMDRIVEAVCGLTNHLDELFPKMSGLSTQERTWLRDSIAQTRRATSPAV